MKIIFPGNTSVNVFITEIIWRTNWRTRRTRLLGPTYFFDKTFLLQIKKINATMSELTRKSNISLELSFISSIFQKSSKDLSGDWFHQLLFTFLWQLIPVPMWLFMEFLVRNIEKCSWKTFVLILQNLKIIVQKNCLL